MRSVKQVECTVMRREFKTSNELEKYSTLLYKFIFFELDYIGGGGGGGRGGIPGGSGGIIMG